MDNQEFDVSNTIRFSVEFAFPEESGSLSEQERINHIASQKTQEFVGRFLSLVLPAKNPRLACIAMAYACGFPVGYLFGCDNTMADISQRIGVTKQAFSVSVKQISQQLNIKTATGMNHDRTEIYKTSNYRTTAR